MVVLLLVLSLPGPTTTSRSSADGQSLPQLVAALQPAVSRDDRQIDSHLAQLRFPAGDGADPSSRALCASS